MSESSNNDDQSNRSNPQVKTEQGRLLSLIEFAQESARLKLNRVSEVTRYGVFNLFEHETLGLPGMHFNKDDEDDELWLLIDRLWESQPPSPNNHLLEMWIDLSNNPEDAPKLKDAIEDKKNNQINIPNQSNNAATEQTKLIFLSAYEEQETVEHSLHEYIKTQWEPWANEEKKRRHTIQIYSKLFALKQQLEGAIADSQIELVWGIGMGIWDVKESKINYPLLTQPVHISLNETDMSISISPTQADPRLETDVYMSIDNLGVNDFNKAYNDFVSNLTQALSPYDQTSFEPILRLAVTHLDPKGIYWPNQASADDRLLPKSSEELKITNTWVLFARPRSKSIFIQDLENFRKQFADEKLALSNVVKAIVTEPSAEHKNVKFPNFRGISSFGNSESSNTKAADLFFPMAFNEEQVNIVQMLDCYDGVVVQGPPGTGKTHTIANIISHYMANGKRILVTSMKEPALSVLKEKLPEAIQPLTISLLIGEQEGMKQFEYAVSKIAQELQSIDRGNLSREIEQTEQHIDHLHAKLAWTDRSINEWARKNIEAIHLDGQTIYPEDAALEVRKFIENYEWLNDKISIKPENSPTFDNADIIRLRDIRRKLGVDMEYLNAKLPEIDDFPESTEILRIHQDLSKYNKLKNLVEKNNYPHLAESTEEIFSQVTLLLKKLSDYQEMKNKINSSGKTWISSIRQKFNKDKSIPVIQAFEQLAGEIKEATLKRNDFISNPIYLPKELELTEEILQAIINKGNGKYAFGLAGLLGKGELKRKINEIKISNDFPKTTKDWQYVYHYIFLQRRFTQLILRWNSIASELSISLITEVQPNEAIKHACNDIEIYYHIKKCLEIESYITKNSQKICPSWPHHQALIENAEKEQEFRNILECHLSYHRLSKAWASKENFQNKLSGCNGQICELIKIFIDHKIGDPSISELQLQNEWSQLMKELRRIHGHRSYFADIKEICERIKDSGAPNWAKKLSEEALQGTVDYLLPDNWAQAWRIRRLSNYLGSISSYDDFKKLSIQRIEIEQQLAKTYQNAVSKQTWLKLAENATPDIKAALQAFQAAIAKIGKGTGKRAVRYRRDARNAASRVNKAIPCWIMPHFKVSESLPPEFGCFDLVIIDEASQSDLSALPAILRASKLLIVGDDKQVSPEGIGLEEDKIKNLMARFLSNQVEIYRHEMSPERSIYDLCKVVFADSQIMLREHFRCVAPIIEYSKREFYNHELKPLRIPKKSERLDPPLIDVIIEDGYRNKDENYAEARFIVDEIKYICDDIKLSNKTIGVVSLLGNEQSRKILDMLEKEIGPEEISHHKIICGDARNFQGNERDIMFLSMVVTKIDDKSPKADPRAAQRFNVAASRARDRMYLVRSIEFDHLSSADRLRRHLIDHFSSPFAQDEIRVKNLRELCESGFECEVYDLLTERGYRVIPQVKVGGFRIDMVIEGNNDTRLAIECDGDRYHDASRWESDMNRQRILERAGWQFWRCFASTFVMNKENVVSDLIALLTKHGIEPIGNDQSISSIHSEQRRLKVLSNAISP